jgi:hypothetical protein
MWRLILIPSYFKRFFTVDTGKKIVVDIFSDVPDIQERRFL